MSLVVSDIPRRVAVTCVTIMTDSDELQPFNCSLSPDTLAYKNPALNLIVTKHDPPENFHKVVY